MALHHLRHERAEIFDPIHRSLVSIGVTTLAIVPTRIVGQVRVSAEGAELAPSLIVANTEAEGPAVRSLVDAAHRRHDRMKSPIARRQVSGRGGVVDLPGLHPDHRAIGRGLHLLTEPVALTRDQCGQDTHRQSHGAAGVGDDRARNQRWIIGRAGHAGDTASRLGVLIAHAVLARWAVRTKSVRDRVDQSWIALRQPLVTHPDPLQRGFAVVAQEHVRGVDQFVDQLQPNLGMDIDADRTLAVRGADKLRADRLVRKLVVCSPVPAIGVAHGRLDLDYIGAHIGEESARGRTLHSNRQLHNPNTLKRFHPAPPLGLAGGRRPANR